MPATKLILPILAIASLTAGSGEAPSDGPSPASSELRLSPCRVPDVEEELRCGVYHVQENRTAPSGRTLPLKVIVLPARSARPLNDPVFYFEGGPGEAATASADYVAGLSIREHRDVVLIDQRGTGEGHRLDCTLEGSDSDLQGYLNSRVPALQRCARDLSARADLTQYVTPIAMEDIDEVRRALGYDSINVYGGSYGSRAAMIYTRMFGAHVRSAYLSGLVPLAARMPLYFAWSAQRAMDKKLEECARDRACASQYPDPLQDLAIVQRNLAERPARVRISHPVTREPVEVLLTGQAFAVGLLRQLYTAEEPATLPALFRRARQGDFTAFVEGAIERERAQRSTTAYGLHRTIVCNEDTSQIRPEQVERETAGTFLGSSLVREAFEICSAWPRAELPEDYFEPFETAVPALMTSGEYDPVTPPRWGEEARRSFPDSIHIVLRQGHHFDESSSPCLNDIMRQFLATAAIDRVDIGCARRGEDGLTVNP
ncbi:MAG: alpha/beta hydrolase [Pseudomonadota bacterium]|nr:alpha/beta hydrolase [Pseudomonadota bacterium]